MKIASSKGVVKPAQFTVTKGISSLILAIDTVGLDGLTTEKINIYIERANGSNVVIANKVLLKDFILLSTYGGEATQSDGSFDLIALCELAEQGAIVLADKESIKIQLEDLVVAVDPADSPTYELYGIEEPVGSSVLYFFEQKTIASEEFSKVLDVKGFDLAVLTTHESIDDLSYRFANGQVVKYLPFELQTLSRDVDPIQAISGVEVLQGLDNRLTLPLHLVDSIEVNKSQGHIINFVVRSQKVIA